MQDISMDQTMEIDKKKLKMKDFMKCTENTTIDVSEFLKDETLDVPVDKDSIRKYEDLIRSSLVWQ